MDARTQRRLEDLAQHNGARGFTFDDLAEAGLESGTDANELTEWLAEARETGRIVELEPETLSDGTVLGPQRFCLAEALARRPSGSGHTCGDDYDTSRSSPGYADCDAPAR